MTLQEIKDRYAVINGYKTWESLVRKHFYNLSSIDAYRCVNEHENEVMKIYARECLKLASERFDEQFRFAITDEKNIIL